MFGGVRQIARARVRMGTIRRKKGKRGNGVSRYVKVDSSKSVLRARARFVNQKTKIEWPTSVPKVGARQTETQQAAAQTHDTKRWRARGRR